MTNQEAFSAVWRHFITNNGMPSLDCGGCRYRGEGGAKCAFGVLLPDEWYNANFEGHGATHVLDILKYDGCTVFDATNRTLLLDLQHAHDRVAKYQAQGVSFTELVEENLKRIASRFNLIIPEG